MTYVLFRQVDTLDLLPQIVQPMIQRISLELDCYIEVTNAAGQRIAAAGKETEPSLLSEQALVLQGSPVGHVRAASAAALPGLVAVISTAVEAVSEQFSRFAADYGKRLAVSAWAQLLTASYAFNDEILEQSASNLGIHTNIERTVFLIRALPTHELDSHVRHQDDDRIGPTALKVRPDSEIIWETLYSVFSSSAIVADLSSHLFFAAPPSSAQTDELKTGQAILQRLRKEGYVVKVGIGGRGRGLSGYRESYDLAKQTLQLQDRLGKNEPILYSEWGVLRLIEAVPRVVRTEFLSNYAQRFEKLDLELVKTLRAFLEHDLNVKRTSEFLHVHRNTLIYRLAQLESATGLDPRRFEDAVLIRVLLWCQDLS